jgi:hypothetical protein
MAKVSWAGKTIDVASTNPSISVQKEIIRTDDGICINQKHNITVKGYFYATGDPIAKARQGVLYGKMIALLNTNASQASLQQGLLELQPEGTVSGGNTLRYKDARLVSVSFPEPPDDTAGIQYVEYSVTFEAHQPKDDIFDQYKISSVSENWNIKKSTEFMTYTGDDISLVDSKYGYEIEHTLSAVGMTKFNANGVIMPIEGAPWYQAWKYVDDKLSSEDADDAKDAKIDKDNFQLTSPSTYKIGTWKPSAGSSNVATELADYKSYNRVRSSAIDVAAGAYSVTSSFTMSNEPYVYDVSAQFSNDESGTVSLTVEGTIIGLSEQNIKGNVNDKITKARLGYDAISGGGWCTDSKGHILADTIYAKYYKQGDSCAGALSLDKCARAITVTENKTAGTISFNVAYKALSTDVYNLKYAFTGAITATLTISDENQGNPGPSVEVVAIIPIIGRKKGPVIQNMGTTRERSRTASIEVLVNQTCRYPAKGKEIASIAFGKLAEYKPGGKANAENPLTFYGTGDADNIYVQDTREEWDWASGRYQASIQWVYEHTS